MQKKLIALAVLAAISAPAFAADDSKVAISVYGILDVGYGNESKTVTVSGAAAAFPGTTTKYDQSALQFSAMTSSRLGFLATEEMADGTKATVKIETGIWGNPMAGFSQTGSGAAGADGTFSTTATLGSRELNLSLAFNEGTTVKAGYGSTPIRDISLGYAADPGGNLVGNILNNDSALGSNRQVSIDVTQQFTPAVKATVGLIKDKTSTTNNAVAVPTTASSDQNGYQFAAQYNQDALSVSLAYQNVKTTTVPTTTTGFPSTDSSQKITILGASYDLGVAKLFGEYASIKNGISTTSLVAGVPTAATQVGDGSRTYTSLGVQAPLGPVLGFAQYSTGTVNRVSTVGVGAESRKITGTTIGVKYNLSKPTYAYLSLGSTDLKAGAVDAGAPGIKVSQLALGLVHTF